MPWPKGMPRKRVTGAGATVAAPEKQTQQMVVSAPAGKRGPGRPKGSKNKPRPVTHTAPTPVAGGMVGFRPQRVSETSGLVPDFLTPEELAPVLRATAREIELECEAGNIPGARRFGFGWRIPKAFLG